MYWIAKGAHWGVGRWGLAFTLPVLAGLFLYGAWHDGYLSRGGIQRFIAQELPLKVQNVLANIGVTRSDKA